VESDFSGYATKAGLKCTDGRTIMPDAFKHQDQMQVPLVWQHGHADPENVLGHVLLENRSDGVYAYGFFNDSPRAQHTKGLVQHKDITALSIWANQLIERSSRVLHGAIREVSLVLSGANPGALIENVTIRHSDGDDQILDDEAIIYTGLELELVHAATTTKEIAMADTTSDTQTVQDIYDGFTPEQKDVVHYMIGTAIEEAATTAQHSEVPAVDLTEITTKLNEIQEGITMSHNVFEQEGQKPGNSLSHDDVKGIVADAMKSGSLKDAVENYALAHGITNIDVLFPEAVAVNGATPEFLMRRTEWVNILLGSTRKSPFSRIKTVQADLTFEEARAKGYVKGALKKEEFFGVSKRVTTPTTIYKKQKLDRDDVLDITDFDVVAWLKAEMRIMLDEELARAILIGDGRDVAHEDKINEGNIRPIASDHELFATQVYVNIDDTASSIAEVVDAIVRARRFYKGTGLPIMFTTETYISMFLLLKDTTGRRIYSNLAEVAAELRVSEIVGVEVLEEVNDIVAVIVNPIDYIIGANKGGEINMFDDFDIDYNQHKYLIETRCCGALAKLKSALVVRKTVGTNVIVSPAVPSFNPTTGDVTINDTTGVVYKNGAGVAVTATGSPYAVAPGASLSVNATPATGYYFASSEEDSWTFTNEA
jgi:hypothetical protein